MSTNGDCLDIHRVADLAVCEQRDTKGLCARARAGEISLFTGISSRYEEPESPELRVDSGSQPIGACLQRVIGQLQVSGILEHLGSADL